MRWQVRVLIGLHVSLGQALCQITLQTAGSGLTLKPEVQIIVVPFSCRDLRAQNGATNHAHAHNNEYTDEWCEHYVVEAKLHNSSSFGEGSGRQRTPQQRQEETPLPILQATVDTRHMRKAWQGCEGQLWVPNRVSAE